METILEKIKTSQRAFRSGVLAEAREPKIKSILFDGTEESIHQIKQLFPKAIYEPDYRRFIIPTEKDVQRALQNDVIIITLTDITVLTLTQFSKLFYITDEPETTNS